MKIDYYKLAESRAAMIPMADHAGTAEVYALLALIDAVDSLTQAVIHHEGP